MRCCQNCFEDEYLITKIKEYDEIGCCEYCHSEEVYVIEVDELTEEFDKLFKHYGSTEPYEFYHPELQGDPSEFGDRLIELINEDWNIFSEDIVGTGTDETLLFDILNSNKRWDPDEYIDPHNLYSRITRAFTFVHPLEEWEDIWNAFKKEIKHSNRFFPKPIIEIFNNSFDDILGLRTKQIDNVELFRSRLGNQPANKMKAPPAEMATAGRANPRGISYLYCALDEKTCIAEIRPWKGAEVTVAQFSLKKSLTIAALNRQPLSPFAFESPYEILAIERILSAFIEELSTPVDPSKSEIEYLPTQYITELIKSKGFDGILFDSAMGPGNNIVLFDQNHLDISKTYTIVVKDIIYEYRSVENSAE
ncbi:RES domain-containing protein [Cytobacillus praedii]|uniref:RES domain-containing protein n=1 Tax=Cytobacillus praedii TaxID=1742358 RepID=UPI002E24877B|nr:RES domain-containing protein [Cytobacillus praedii]